MKSVILIFFACLSHLAHRSRKTELAKLIKDLGYSTELKKLFAR